MFVFVHSPEDCIVIIPLLVCVYIDTCYDIRNIVIGLLNCTGSIVECLWGLLNCTGSIVECLWGLLNCTGSIVQCLWGLLNCTGSIVQCLWGLLNCTGLYCSMFMRIVKLYRALLFNVYEDC